jgi:hypothetical protein
VVLTLPSGTYRRNTVHLGLRSLAHRRPTCSLRFRPVVPGQPRSASRFRRFRFSLAAPVSPVFSPLPVMSRPVPALSVFRFSPAGAPFSLSSWPPSLAVGPFASSFGPAFPFCFRFLFWLACPRSSAGPASPPVPFSSLVAASGRPSAPCRGWFSPAFARPLRGPVGRRRAGGRLSRGHRLRPRRGRLCPLRGRVSPGVRRLVRSVGCWPRRFRRPHRGSRSCSRRHWRRSGLLPPGSLPGWRLPRPFLALWFSPLWFVVGRGTGGWPWLARFRRPLRFGAPFARLGHLAPRRHWPLRRLVALVLARNGSAFLAPSKEIRWLHSPGFSLISPTRNEPSAPGRWLSVAFAPEVSSRSSSLPPAVPPLGRPSAAFSAATRQPRSTGGALPSVEVGPLLSHAIRCTVGTPRRPSRIVIHACPLVAAGSNRWPVASAA